MFYRSSRHTEATQNFKGVTLEGLAPDGGLYVPDHMPAAIDWRPLEGARYQDIAFTVMKAFAGETVTDERLKDMINGAYGDQFADPAIAPLKRLADNDYVLELFHGPTLAFKDMALQMLGQLFEQFTGQDNRRLTILGATSGDTGSAAIEAVKGRDRLKIVMLHPYGRVSDVQRRQMTTVQAENVLNIAIDGTFDDCQALVKAAFAERAFAEKVSLGAVNSINWARVMAQVVYYASTCLALGLPEEGVNFSVPTGNFGDIYAGYLARLMGLPVGQLIIATNANDILVRTHQTGLYARGGVEKTLSPSMDIQVSSNFERYLSHHLDADSLTDLMAALKSEGAMTLPPQALEALQREFAAVRVSDEETQETIRAVMAAHSYAMDPHTAIGYRAAHAVAHTGPMVTLATAHPAKFPAAMQAALGDEAGGTASALPLRLAALMEGNEHYERLGAELGPLMARVEEFAGER